MRTEDFIARCKLLSLLRTLPDRDLTSDERLQLISAFRLFVRQIAHRTRTEESKLDLLRLYACLRTAFKYLKVHRSVPTDLVRAFERFLNVSILNPDRCRYTTINRKLHLTKFLDTMREALVELSQR